MRRRFTFALLIVLLLSSLWTAWQWFRPYDPTNETPWQIKEVTVRRDHDYAWMEIELSLRSNEKISSTPLSRIIDPSHAKKEPADVRISSDGQSCQIRYWLEWAELESAWSLQMHDDTLRIKKAGAITLENGQTRTFRQPNW